MPQITFYYHNIKTEEQRQIWMKFMRGTDLTKEEYETLKAAKIIKRLPKHISKKR